MNEKIKQAIRQRAVSATSKDELVSAVFDSFRHARISPRRVSLEDMKTAVFLAARTAAAEGQIDINSLLA